MKSRVIQDGPEPESSAHHGAMDVCEKQMQRAMNIAGRMGHWSATHWKTAVFGYTTLIDVSAREQGRRTWPATPLNAPPSM